MHRSLPESSKPILVPEKVDIARKPKANEDTMTNGAVTSNGNSKILAGSQNQIMKRKRSADDNNLDGDQAVKHQRVPKRKFEDDDLVLVEDSSNGAIVIDDD